MRSDVTELFEPGDLVQLKSGGPIMTVDKIVEDGPADLLRGGVFAIWFRLRQAPSLPVPTPVPAAGRKRVSRDRFARGRRRRLCLDGARLWPDVAAAK